MVPSSPSVYLCRCRVIDAAAGNLLEGEQTIHIRSGEFVQVSPTDGFRYEDESAPRIDLGGRFVCPGLIDAHVHVTATPGGLVSLHSCLYHRSLAPCSLAVRGLPSV